MSSIREYLSKSNLPDILLDTKVAIYEKHQDIAREFEYWINTGEYIVENAISVKDYTAKDIAALSELMDGEGAFNMLIQLRENPEKALKKIARGFKIR